VIKNSVDDDEGGEWGGANPTSSVVLAGSVIRNCGCHLLSHNGAPLGRRFLPRSGSDRDGICNTFCVHLSGTHFSTTPEECLCFSRPPAIDCEEIEDVVTAEDGGVISAVETVKVELKCVDKRPAQPSPTRRNSVSQSVLSFLRSMTPNTHGNGVTFGEYGEYEDEVQRHGRHVTDGGRETNRLRSKVVTAAAASTPAYKTSTSSGFGPSKSVGLAATLILLAFICIFTMGLKTWYHKRRKDQKEKEEPAPEVKKDIDWEKIMSY